MIKKLTASILTFTILSLGIAVLARAPKSNRADCEVPAARLTRRAPEANKSNIAQNRVKPKAKAEVKMPWLRTKKAENAHDMLRKRAEALGIDITGLTDDEIKAKVKAAMEEQRVAKKHEGLQKWAEALGIDTTGLTYDEIKAKVKAAMEEQMAERKREGLQKRAEALGIDTAGLTDDEIKAKIMEAIREKGPVKKPSRQR